MTNLRTYVALTATIAFIAIGQSMNAQDDLDDLLADLEGESPAAAPAAEEKAEEPAAEEPAAEEPAAEEPAPAAEAAEPAAEEPAPAPAAEEPAAEEPAPAAEEPAAEEPAADQIGEAGVSPAPAAEAADTTPAPAAEEPAPAAEEPAAEAPAAEEPAAAEEKVDDALNLLDELAAEDSDSKPETPAADQIGEAGVSPAPAAEAADTTPEASVSVAPAITPVSRAALADRKDGKLIDEILTTEKLRREALDVQAMREIREAKDAMASGQYVEAVRHYGIAVKLLNDSPTAMRYKSECTEGIAEGLYRAALEEERTGRRARAIKYMEKAVDLRHPKARRQLEAWLNAEDPDANKTDVSEILHRRNEADYKQRRETERRHLKRARQLLAQRELDLALDECELVLVKDPYNQEAIRLRDSIVRKSDVILKQERDVAREKWIADVDRAWRPPYATDAKDRDDKKGATVKAKPDPKNGERTIEQSIIQRMKEMRLPAISFKPPATIIDAVEYFRGASKDFDRPEIPLEQRGFNFVLKTPEAVRMQAAAAASEDADDFSDTGSDDAANAGGPLGVPVIPMITASDITFYDALKLVCESVEYKFTVQGPIVMVMHKDMSVEELVTRSFPVLSSFTEKMGSATEDIKSMKSSTGFGGASRQAEEGEENEQRDWKEFFSLLGVKWPEGSSIFYVKTVGRLFVKNTQENLAEFENVLAQLNQQVTLVEIETRFIEVCQDDLNSLGFEWILNSDYTLGLNKHLAKALGIRGGGWGARAENSANAHTVSGSETFTSKSDSLVSNGGKPSVLTSDQTIKNSSDASTWSSTRYTGRSSGADWVRTRGNRNVGVTAIDGTDYSTGQRYLSTLSNHISGESKSTNDQFMRLNAFLGSADLSMILHMLSQRSDTDLLSAPKVLTRPGEEAVMKVVTEYIYPTDYDVQLQSSRLAAVAATAAAASRRFSPLSSPSRSRCVKSASSCRSPRR